MRVLALIVLLAVAMSGCAPQAEVDSLRKQVAALDGTLQSSSAQIVELREEVQKLQSVSKADPWEPNFGWVGIADSGYALATTDHGRIAITLVELKAHGGGARAVLGIVNLSSVGLTNVEIRAQYMNYTLAEYLSTPDAELEMKEASTNLPGPIAAGRETTIILNLPDMPHDKIRAIGVLLKPKGMRHQ